MIKFHKILGHNIMIIVSKREGPWLARRQNLVWMIWMELEFPSTSSTCWTLSTTFVSCLARNISGVKCQPDANNIISCQARGSGPAIMYHQKVVGKEHATGKRWAHVLWWALFMLWFHYNFYYRWALFIMHVYIYTIYTISIMHVYISIISI